MNQQSVTLKDKVVLITDVGTDSGMHTALFCAGQQASLILNCPNEIDASLKSKLLSLNNQVFFTNFDVSVYKNGELLIETIIDKYQKLDSLVNTPDFCINKSLENIETDEFYDSLRLGLKATFIVTKFACSLMRKQGFGSITNMTSDAGLGMENAIGYSATSEGTIGMTRTVARDMSKYGVICNAIAVSDFVSAAVLASSFCLDSMQAITGRTFGTQDGSIFVYQEPRPIDTISKWGGFEVEDLESIIPTTIQKTLSDN